MSLFQKLRTKSIKVLLLVAGTFSLALGAIGIVLPILPTTPFLLVSAACYIRSSDKNAQVAAAQQVVWRVHKKLSGR